MRLSLLKSARGRLTFMLVLAGAAFVPGELLACRLFDRCATRQPVSRSYYCYTPQAPASGSVANGSTQYRSYSYEPGQAGAAAPYAAGVGSVPVQRSAPASQPSFYRADHKFRGGR